MDRARVTFLALLSLVILVGLVVWIHSLNQRVDYLSSQVETLSSQIETFEKRMPLPRPPGTEGAGPSGRVGTGTMMYRRGEGATPSPTPAPARTKAFVKSRQPGKKSEGQSGAPETPTQKPNK